MSTKSHGALTRSPLFHEGGPYHIKTSPFIWSANQWTGFYMIAASVMKEVNISLFSLVNVNFFGKDS